MGMIDFSPLFRSTIGFDRLSDLLDDAMRYEPSDNYPPYNIEKTDEDTYRITMAVAGFAPEDITITVQPNLLVVAGRRPGREAVQYLHHGLAMRPFERRFELADYVQVSGAKMENGLLSVELARELPDSLKPHTIQIASAPKPKTIEAQPVGTPQAA
ncbi:Hsp20 family protein [Azospirillum canadense]|uniref:Hsp20 family protein n=1 Tax=Azospirillum canadense TaxID=403962 RepID=UPI002227E628|nr:Hsp20 family protein [Azospirillum canadense]MCW2242518.1 molecular chaperone IbpA [Azospirillum canadense]